MGSVNPATTKMTSVQMTIITNLLFLMTYLRSELTDELADSLGQGSITAQPFAPGGARGSRAGFRTTPTARRAAASKACARAARAPRECACALGLLAYFCPPLLEDEAAG